MTVDELLEKNIITPTFTCVTVKPTADSLRILEIGDTNFLYAKGHTQYMSDATGKLNMDEYTTITGCAQCEIITTDNISMLMAFLRLAQSARDVEGKHMIEFDDLLTFCYKFGIPMYQMPYIEGKGRLIGFSMERFAERLDNLYVCYALWKALQLNQDDLLKIVQRRPMTIDRMQLEFENRLYSDIMVKVLYKDNKPSLIYQADNPMALVEAQLAVLASTGDDYLKGGYIANCADCGQPFFKDRRNATLCKDCKGSTGKSRRYRAKKKGAQNNG